MKTIQSYLMALGLPALTELLGSTFVEQIVELTGKASETNLANFLCSLHGSGILADKRVRRAILESCSDSDLKQMQPGILKYDRQSTLNSMGSAPWASSSKLPKLVIETLRLPFDLLPEGPSSIPAIEMVVPEWKLFEHQRHLRTRIIRQLEGPGARCLVHMPTGSGKTRTALEAVSDFWRTSPNGLIIWLAHSEELCEQALSTWKNVWRHRGDFNVPIVRYWGKYKPDLKEVAEGIIVGGLQKIYAGMVGSGPEYEQMLYLKNQATLVIVDEAHRALAPTYLAVINFLLAGSKQPKLIGLTATPGRNSDDASGENQQLVDFFGGPASRLTLQDQDGMNLENPVQHLQKLGYLAKIHRNELRTHTSVVPTQDELNIFKRTGDIPESLLKRIASDHTRNKVIFEELRRLAVDQKKKVICFACTVSQAQLLAMALRERGIESACIDSSTSSKDRERIVNDFKNKDSKIRILLNYEVLTTGFDAPSTDCVFIARPTGSIVLYSQIIGRGLRGPLVGGNEFCTIVDVIDNIVSFPSENWAFNYFNTYWSDNE